MSYKIHQEVREEEERARNEEREQNRTDAIHIRNMIGVLKRKKPRDQMMRELYRAQANALRRALYRLPNPYDKYNPEGETP